MKKIIRITSYDKEKYGEKDFKNAEKKVEGITVSNISPDEIFYDIDGKFKFYDNKKDIESFDIFWISKKLSKDFSETIEYYFFLKGKKIVDRSYVKKIGKSGQSIYFNHKGIKTPKTIIILNSKKNLQKNINLAESRFKYPFIAKYSNMSRGEGVFLIKERSDLENLLINSSDYITIIIQEFIKNNGDYRVIATKEKIIGSIKRYNANYFKNNISTGGTSEKVEILPKSIEKVTLELINDLGYDLLGIDFFIDGENYKVIELNTAPQYNGFQKSTGIDLCVELLKYFKKI